MVNPRTTRLELAHGDDVIRVETTAPLCARLGTSVSCHVTITDRATDFQLPLLYYPRLLDVRVNGTPASYFPLPFEHYLMASVRLEPGIYDLVGRFRGLAWADATSAIAWIGMLAGSLWSVVRRVC